MKVDKICKTCKNTFASSYDKQRFCSRQCAKPTFGWAKGLIRTKYKKNCLVCNSEFDTVPSSSKQKTCSRECSSILRKRNPRLLNCKFCGNSFQAKKNTNKYCSKSCGSQSRWEGKILSPIFYAKKVKRELLTQITGCQRCGYDVELGILELHHKDRDPKNNSKENVELICPNCHTLEHFMTKTGQFSNNLGRL